VRVPPPLCDRDCELLERSSDGRTGAAAHRIERTVRGAGASGDANIGEVTSGTFGPTVQKSIAMAYVDAHHAAEGTTVQIDLKGEMIPAKVVKLPFYKRPQ